MARTAVNPTRLARVVPVLACTLLLAGAPLALARGGVRKPLVPPSSAGAAPASVTLEQCLTSTVQAERSATFTEQMTATPATQRMAMRIELQERMRGEADFHTIVAPGFGAWRSSEPGVKIYKYFKQVTNLAAPASYRAVVHFRWLGEKGKILKRAELHTPRCLQPTLPSQVVQTPPAAS